LVRASTRGALPKSAIPAASSSRSGIMFHGGLGRYDHGLREGMLELLQHIRRASQLGVDTQTGEMSRGDNRSAYSVSSYERTAESYLRSSMCLVPSGDVPSSRRLFDVMAAGCVPILVRSFWRMSADAHSFTTSLPFPQSIDWYATTLWLAPPVRAKNKHACMAEISNWVNGWHAQSECALETTRQRSRAAFATYLDVEHHAKGTVWALLREIEHRSRHCDLTTGRQESPPARNNSVDDPLVCPYYDVASGRQRRTARLDSWQPHGRRCGGRCCMP